MGNGMVMVASFLMGLFAYTAANFIRNLYDGSKIPKDMAGWNEEVERACMDVIRAKLYVATTERRLSDLVGEVPADFNSMMFSAPAIAQAVEKAAMAKVESDGDPPTPRFATVTPISGPADDHTWIAGQLLRKVC